MCHVEYFGKERVASIFEVQVKLEGVDECMYVSGPGLLLKMTGQFSVPIT